MAAAPVSWETLPGLLPSRLVVVGCVAGKGTRPAALGELYRGQLWRDRSGYARASGHPWAIASAFYGVRWPDYPAAPYDRRVGDLTRAQLDCKALVAAWRLAHWRARHRLELGLVPAAGRGRQLDGLVVELHAGADYVEWLRPALESFGAVVELPLAGLGIGHQLGWYKLRR